jgi:hypothetical protein
LYIVDVDQTGESLDRAPGVDRKRKASSSSKSGISAVERMRMAVKTVGAKVAVGYVAEGRKYRQYWEGRVVDSKPMANSDGDMVDHILVSFESNGETPACEDWVELDRYVRLCVDPLADAK